MTLLQIFCDMSADFCFVFWSMDGGELFSRIQDRGDQAFTERGNGIVYSLIKYI